MKKLLLTTLFLLTVFALSAKTYSLISPDGSISVEVNVNDKVTYSVNRNGYVALENCAIAMETSIAAYGAQPKVKSAKTSEHRGVYRPFNHYKSREVADNYNELKLVFNGGWSLEFRAYDNGAAYRIITAAKGRMTVSYETVEYRMPQEAEVCLSLENMPGEKDPFRTMYERKYTFEKVADLDAEKQMSYLPILATTDNWVMLITETDLYDYPAVFFHSDSTDALKSIFPKVVNKTEPYNARRETVIGTEKYIAETDAARTFPWRVITLVDNEAELIHSHLTGQMARGRDMNVDWSWIKPGKVSWDWWCDFTLPGVDFVYGVNNQTYKYFIDFYATVNGINFLNLFRKFVVRARNATDFSLLILYPATLWNSLIRSNTVLVSPLEFSVYKIMLSVNIDNFSSFFSILMSFISFSHTIALFRTSVL